MTMHHLSRVAIAALATAGFASAQDECTNAVNLPLGVATAFSTVGSTTSAPGWPCAAGGSDIWYSITVAVAGGLNVNTCGSGYDTALELFSGTCAGLVSLACNDDFCGLQSTLNAGVTPGTYFLRVGGFASQMGAGTVIANVAPPATNDECATALAILVNTPTAFDTGSATTGPDAFSCSTGGLPHANDIWYRYTATSNNDVAVSLCGSGFDTLLQAHSGTCAALNSLACNDDSCGLQSTIRFSAVSGQSYYIQVAGWNGASGVGTIEVTELPPATLTIVDNLPGTWIDISATGTALNLADDASVDIATTIGNSLLAAGTVRVGSNGAVRFAGAGQALGFTNTTIPSGAAFSIDSQVLMGFWDDINTVSGTVGNIYWRETQGRLIVQWQAAGFFGSPSTETVTFQIQVPSGAGNVKAQFLYQDVLGSRAGGGVSATIGYQAGTPANQNDVEWSFNTGSVSNGTVLSLVEGGGGGGVGTNFCTANPNSTGQTGLISGTGSASVAANNLTLAASRLPNNSFGYFLTSTTEAVTPNPGGSQGILCLGGQIGRYNGAGQIQNSGATGSFSLLLNLTMIPTPTGFVAAVAGQTRSFTTWHRDSVGGVATSNFTNGLRVTFQ
jgi:hypothetical protein